ncbi:MAG: methionine--tRNA ligase [Balneolaceae bacterium]|nr:methionine--tRNA ligase [Balneolaceae bacterium]
MEFKRTLITSALPYANGPLHIGHLAGAYLPSDLYTRYLRLRGDDVIHICGSDEHGVPITLAAEREEVPPQVIVDRYHTLNAQTFTDFGIEFDHYGRTSSKKHHKSAQEFFLTLDKKGVFKKKSEKQLYDETVQMFLPDRYVKGICPHCSFDQAYGDQCESCGTSLSPSDLINPISALTGSKPILKETEHWFLPLGDFEPFLTSWMETNQDWKAHVQGQIQSWLAQGLGDRAVTRDLTWGVPVPLDHAEGKVLYVWFDAPIGYISATMEWAEAQGDPSKWKTYWQDKHTRLIHFIGKDNIVFHCIIFPAMLEAHGDYILADQVPANEFLNLEGQKLSTSKGWAIWLHELKHEVEPDLIRYYLACTLPENKDSDFSWRDFQTRVNNDLADVMGNFAFRTLSFIHRFEHGVIPTPKDLSPHDKETLQAITRQKQAVEQAMDGFRFKEAVGQAMELARVGNRYFSDSEPWKTRKTDPQRCANTLYVSAQVCAALTWLFAPFMPTKMGELAAQMSLGPTDHPSHALSWKECREEILEPGQQLGEASVLFPKIEDEWVDKQRVKLQKAPSTPSS